MYGHDTAHTGRASADGPLNLVPRWSLPLGTLINTNDSPVIGPDGSIYVTTWTQFFAVNPNGTVRCQVSLLGAAAAPAVSSDGSAVYVPDQNGLHKLNPTTCATVWDFSSRITYSSPTIGPDGTIYFGSAVAFPISNSHLYALNPDKTIKWDWDSGSICWIESSPALGPNGQVYFVHNCLGVVALNSTGNLLWSHSGLGNAFDTTSVGPDGTVYVGNSDHNFYALNPADGTTKWQVAVTNFMYNASASISQDGSRIYRGDNGGIFYAFNSTGTVAWQYDTGVSGGIFSAPALSANDVVYFTQDAANGNLYALRASDKTLLATHQIGSSQSSPALGSNGTLYAVGNDSGGNGVLYAFPLIADLAIGKSDSPDPVAVSSPLTYALTATNNGPNGSSKVKVVDTLPSTVTLGSATPSQGSCSASPTVPVKVICNLGTLASGANATITIVVTPTVAGTITNKASITSKVTFDPTSGNNKASATTTVTGS